MYYGTFKKDILPLRQIRKQGLKSSLVKNYHKKMLLVKKHNHTGNMLSCKQIASELNDLREIATKIVYNKKRNLLGILTDVIIRHGNNLGEWYIVVSFNKHPPWAFEEYFEVWCFPINKNAYHKHVYESHRLCRGNGYMLDERLAQGRITDFFMITQQVLRT